MDLDSLETFADIAFQCLQKFRQERPTMSDVVEKLTIALEMQEDHDTIGNLPKKYDQIIKAAGDPLNYTSLEELKALLSNGVLLNGGKTWFSINDQGKHCERVYIEACLKQSQEEFLQHPSDDYVNTRFPGGRCYEYKDDINGFRHGIHLDSVRTQFLSLLITYTVNVVFRYKPKSDVSNYMILRYHMNNDWKRKVVTVYKTDMREDGWFVAELYQFTSQCKAIDLRIYIASCKDILIAGFEFQPIKEKVEPPVLEEYQEILKAASNSQLIYKSAEELKVLLSIGIHLNEYKTWFSMNEKGQHCEMISIIDCLIPPDNIDRTDSSTFSRFPAGFYEPPSRKYHLHVHVKTQFLSPLIPYSVNLVYHTYRDPLNKQLYLPFCYKLKGETETSTVYLSDEISDSLYMAELYKFTSDGRIVDLEILIDNERRDLNYGRYRIHFEGISFQPLKNVEDQVLADDKVEDMQTISDSDTYWKEKLPNDYEEILKMSKDKVEWTTKKEIYSILRKGFLIDNCQLQKWFSIDKSGKKCQMLSATCVIDDCYLLHLESPDESRFGKVPLVSSNCFTIKSEIKCQDVSPETTYDVYLVYKLPQEQSAFVAPFEVTGRHPYDHRDRYIYLASPHTPVIGPKLDEDTQNTVTRPNKLNVVPQQRSDGWMEVKTLR
nr:hypothetical protein [Tanacetum cinerariifolium]